MSRPTPDPTRWLTELMSTEHVMWPGLDIADTTKAMAAATAPWTKAVADITALQLEALKTLAAPWTVLLPGVTPAAEPIKDRRFADDAWTKDPRYEAVARTYLAQTDLMRKALAAAPIDEGSKAQWGFALQQVMDALSPANTLATNPEALQLAMETGGASLLEGMRLFTEDLAKGRISMTDETAFEVGRNVGTTPGAVVFENELFQLIQYTPMTAKVYERPLLIVPPCINKFYILDLQPENSFVAHAVGQGHRCSSCRWRNAGAEQGTLTWDDYIEEGVIKAIEVAQEITGADKVEHARLLRRRHAAGHRARGAGRARRAAGREHDAADDPARLQRHRRARPLRRRAGDAGRARGGDRQGRAAQGQRAGAGLRSLRPNDLVWNYVVKQLPQGQDAAAVRPAVLEQRRHQPARADVLLVPAQHLPREQPARAGRHDPAAASRSTSAASTCRPTSTRRKRGPHRAVEGGLRAARSCSSNDVTFVLGASGHIAGVINPPAKNKRNYWTNETLDPEPEGWFDGAEKVGGSWWPAGTPGWPRTPGTQVNARRKPGNAQYQPVEEAPGAYVREKAS